MELLEDFDRTCRSCLSSDPMQSLCTLADEHIRNMYTKYTALKVSPLDGLPQNICTSCSQKCDLGIRFQVECQQNEIILLRLLANSLKKDEDPDLAEPAEKTVPMDIADDSNAEEKTDEINVKVEPNSCNDYDEDSDNGDQESFNIKCQYCGSVFESYVPFEEHIRVVHAKEKVHSCSDCDAVYSQLPAFRKHMYRHSGYGCRPETAQVKREREKIPVLPVRGAASRITCQFCEEKCPTVDLFKIHLKQHKGQKDFQCKECEAWFTSARLFKEHMYIHSDFEFECSFCRRRFNQPAAILNHRYVCRKTAATSNDIDSNDAEELEEDQLGTETDDHNEAVHDIKCQYCEMSCKGFEEFENHVKVHLREKPFNCKDCPATYQGFHAFKRHMYKHSGYGERPDGAKFDRQFKPIAPEIKQKKAAIRCQICEKTFERFEKFEHHVKYHKSQDAYTCKECGKEFKRKCQFKGHMYEHSDLRFDCKKCNEMFQNPIYYRKHVYSCLNPLVCEVCGSTFGSARLLGIHALSHTNERPFECDICRKRFKSERRLAYHRMRHTGEKTNLCDFCDKSFIFQADLTDHQKRVHEGNPSCVCMVCGKSFHKDSVLRIHMRCHTNERPFQCDQCPAKFRVAFRLKEHKRIHTGEKPFTCTTCSKTFPRNHSLKEHIKRQHSHS